MSAANITKESVLSMPAGPALDGILAALLGAKLVPSLHGKGDGVSWDFAAAWIGKLANMPLYTKWAGEGGGGWWHFFPSRHKEDALRLAGNLADAGIPVTFLKGAVKVGEATASLDGSEDEVPLALARAAASELITRGHSPIPAAPTPLWTDEVRVELVRLVQDTVDRLERGEVPADEISHHGYRAGAVGPFSVSLRAKSPHRAPPEKNDGMLQVLVERRENRSDVDENTWKAIEAVVGCAFSEAPVVEQWGGARGAGWNSIVVGRSAPFALINYKSATGVGS